MTNDTTALVKIGNLTYEVPGPSVAELLDQLQAWADENDKPISLSVTILPAGAKDASDLITNTLREFRR
jgi:hypothetical protein